MPIRRPTTGPFAGPEVASPTDQGAATDFSAVSVPISQPRYQFKTRVNRKMTVTDTSASETDNGRSPSDYLSHRGREALHVRQGPLSYSEPIEYRSYACYRHGARQIHTHSVGYSSDGDLILMRREVSVVSDRDDPLRSVRRRGVGVDSATCLNPKAKPSAARLDEDADPSRWQGARIDRLKKYPGVRCPKNRKTRNRLLNDHFSTAATRALYDAAAADSDPEGLRRPAERIFEPLPPRVAANLLHGTEAAQQAEMKRLGLLEAERVVKQRAPASVNSAAFRFAQLNARLKGELQHAVSSTDFMPGFIEDLEAQVQSLITAAAASTDAPRSLVVPCKDGYGRLITHGVAAFYRLTSQSETTDDGARVTVVALPKKAVALPEQRLLSYLRGGADRSPNPGSMSPPAHATSTPIPIGAKASMPLGSSLSSPEVEGVPTAATRSTRAIPIRRLHRRFGRSRCFPVGASVTPDFGAVDCEESSPAEDSADEAAAAATRRLRFRRRRRVALGAGMSKLVMPSSMADP